VQHIDEIRKEPYALPENFFWSDLDLKNQKDVEELYSLLTNNYVQDEDAMFRFDYKIPFLRWALTPPGYFKNWHLGVRGGKKNTLFAFIAGIPVNVVANGIEVKMCEINYLCVHHKLRAKKLAPVLIKEITRRVNCEQIWQAIYTAGPTIPTPFGHATYWHRNINCKKLIDIRFSSLKAGVPLSRHIRLHKLPDEPSMPGIRVMKAKDIEKVKDLLNNDLENHTKVHFHWSSDEVKHFLLPQQDVIYSYVVEDSKGSITDFFSFYSLPSSVLKENPGDHKILNAAYSFYNASSTGRVKEGLADLLVFAEKQGFDVFNCLDLYQNNVEILKELKFGIGDGRLHYYLYNWRVHSMPAPDIGVVLV
jgi:glycylpeptide N-tetradecanoyltransferase